MSLTYVIPDLHGRCGPVDFIEVNGSPVDD
jgi:hypothetical protein